MREELERRGEAIEALKVDLEAELLEKEELMEQLSADFSRLKTQVPNLTVLAIFLTVASHVWLPRFARGRACLTRRSASTRN